MNKIFIAVLLLSATLALAYEQLLGSVTGTSSQTYVFGARQEVCMQCTTAVRYKLGTALNPPTAVTTDVRVDVGDCYKLTPRNGMDRVAVIHNNGATSFTCYFYDVVTR